MSLLSFVPWAHPDILAVHAGADIRILRNGMLSLSLAHRVVVVQVKIQNICRVDISSQFLTNLWFAIWIIRLVGYCYLSETRSAMNHNSVSTATASPRQMTDAKAKEQVRVCLFAKAWPQVELTHTCFFNLMPGSVHAPSGGHPERPKRGLRLPNHVREPPFYHADELEPAYECIHHHCY